MNDRERWGELPPLGERSDTGNAQPGGELMTPSFDRASDGAPARRVPREGTWRQVYSLAKYMTRTEVHTYAFSVAAQVILSLFPFIVLLLTVSEQVFHSEKMTNVAGQMMMNFLPNDGEFVIRNMKLLAHTHAGTKLLSLVMLLITTTGVFLPLEVALNHVWGVKKNRNYLHNQVVSIGLALGVGLLAMGSVSLSAAQQTATKWLFMGHVDNIIFRGLGRGFLETCSIVAGIALFFMVYWILPNRKIPARSVLPTAIMVGLVWAAAKYLYIWILPMLDFESVYGPFRVSVALMIWAFISGLLLMAGGYVSATRHALREAEAAEELERVTWK